MSPGSPPRYAASDLGRMLAAPSAGEEFSPIDGPGVVVLDLAETSPEDARLWRSSLLDQLPILPCVTVAILPEDHEDSILALALACDVTLPESDDLESFIASFARTPVSALSFVQLLRSTSTASIHAGLMAESFVYSTLQSGNEFREWLETRSGHKVARGQEEEPACRLERDRGRLTITLSRPARHNAFSREMRDAFVEGLQLAQVDPSIEEVVLRGEGESFCSGGDLDEFGTFSDPAEAHVIRTTRSPALLIARLAGRIRAEVHGACIGAGVELPAFTDRIVAFEDAFFQIPEIGLGLVPGAGGTVSLPRRIGRQRTAWLGLSGSRIDAQTALAWGLVDEIRLAHYAEVEVEAEGRGSG